jgi:hypothetical protein
MAKVAPCKGVGDGCGNRALSGGDPIATDQAKRVDVTFLLKAYREAVLRSREPPGSSRLPWSLPPSTERRFLRWHLRIRPSWGTEFWTVRYARRRTQELRRALAGTLAVGDAHVDDDEALQALERFEASLPPPPSRWLTVPGLIVAILIAQGLVDWLIRLFRGLTFIEESEATNKISQAFREIDLSPDVQSLGGLGVTPVVRSGACESSSRPRSWAARTPTHEATQAYFRAGHPQAP